MPTRQSVLRKPIIPETLDIISNGPNDKKTPAKRGTVTIGIALITKNSPTDKSNACTDIVSIIDAFLHLLVSLGGHMTVSSCII